MSVIGYVGDKTSPLAVFEICFIYGGAEFLDFDCFYSSYGSG